MRDPSTTRVAAIQLSQPISVAVQLCLVDLLESWGIVPTAVTSHSSGEIAAAYTVKVLSFKEALGVAYFRGELALKHMTLHSLKGGMLAAAVSPETAEQYIANTPTPGGRVVVACVNSPSSVTLSGDVDALDEVAARLEEDGVFARKLKVPMAYHSHHMEYIEKEYIEKLRSILPTSAQNQWGDGAIFVSPVTGEKFSSPAGLSPEHWARNMTSPVLFSQAFNNMISDINMVVEIGAHSTLMGPVRQILKVRDLEMPYVSCLKRFVDAVETMQDLACELIGQGYPVNLKQVNSPFDVEGQQQIYKLVTDLPSYPWNHSKKYWVEPRISQEQRFKKFPPHELLGTPLNGSNGLTPTWRNFLRLDEIPWLNDHQIDGSVVFPGAGYIANAIEAVRLLTDPSEETIRGYRLRDIDIMNAMIIPNSIFGVETQLTLRPCSEKEFDHAGWWQFELSSLTSGGSWIEHCKGFVSAETGEETRSDLTRELKAPNEESYLQQGDNIPEADVDIETFFAGLRERGIYHGPEFQNLINSRAAGKRAITNFAIADSTCKEHDYVLHPTTLDSILQASFGSLPNDMDKDTMVLPRYIRTLSLPRTFKRQGGEKLQAFSELVKADKKGYTSRIAVVATKSGDEAPSGFLQMEDFFGQAVPRSTGNTTEEACICSKSCWELDVLHKLPEDIKKSLAIPIAEQEIEFERNLVEGSFYWIHDAVVELEGQSQDNWKSHHKRMFDWMKTIVDQAKQGAVGPGSQTWHKTSKGLKTMLGDELNAGDVVGRLVARVGRNLAGILRGDVVPIELMMEGNLLNQFYMDHKALKTRSYKQLSAIVELYALKNPGAKVLEIGAGTGGATTTVLDGFSIRGDDSASILGHYTFTDISPGFFEVAKSKFAAWSSLMDYQKLDIEVDPLEQGFMAGAYDMIVSSFCLHATKSLYQTMTHVRKLLKPGGTLLLIEATADRLPTQLIFGTLPGWWLGVEPERQTSPNAPLDMWDGVLREVGFTGVDLEVPDYEEPEFQSSRVMSSRALTTVQERFSIVLPPGQEAVNGPAERQQWLSQLAETIQAQIGVVPSIVSLDDVQSWQETICIFTAEMERPFVDGLDADAFENQRKLLLNSAGLLWLSCGGLVDATEPSFAATDGLIRTMRQEDATKRWIKLDFEHDSNPWTKEKIEHIVHVLQQSFDTTLEPADVEWEYAVKDSMLRVSRSFPDKAQDALARNLNVDPVPELQLYHQEGRPLIWEVPTSGTMGLNPYFVYNQEVVTTDVPSGMVEVEAKVFGLNFREVMVQLGQLDEPLKGYECSGIVTALGPNTEQSGLKVGNRVCALVRGRMASKGRTWWTSVAKIPDEMDISWEEAASFPAAYVTAYGSLMQVARLQKGESVLVHAAAGGTGQAAIILAQSVGAEVFATCSTKAKRDLLMQQYGIPEDHIFSSRDASFSPAIMARTSGNGVDVVLNSLSGPLLKATWDCMARFGRFVDITKMDIEANRHLETAPFARCAVYTSFDLLQLTEYCGRLTHEALVECVRIVHNRGEAPVYPITPYSISEMATAMRQIQGGQHVGKLVLVPRDGDKVQVSKLEKIPCLFNPLSNCALRSLRAHNLLPLIGTMLPT
jgi:NADPH:quinone reductase-like Zn-dependent oxidoreductase/malonyl CoA-acyl carrier protein transacylase/SAM-dependent methyltransferase